jgi:tight adherence protein B
MLTMQMILLLAGLTMTFVLVGAALITPSTGKATSRRLDTLKERYSSSSAATMQAKMRRIIANRETRFDNVIAQFVPRPALLRERLSRTGKTWTLPQYMMACGGIAVVGFTVMVSQHLPVLLALILSLGSGLGVPHMVVSKLINRRIAKFNAKFPDAIELLVRGLRSGLPISETLNVVAQEVPGPVGVEFRSVADKIRIGRTMDAALQDTAQRLGTPEFQFFCITIAIQRETGGNLAETLSNLSDVLRKRSQMKLKIKAMSSEAKASAYIVGALPFIVFALVYFMNPSYLQGFFTETRLMIAGGGGLAWMGIGVAIMAKMINFEI